MIFNEGGKYQTGCILSFDSSGLENLAAFGFGPQLGSGLGGNLKSLKRKV